MENSCRSISLDFEITAFSKLYKNLILLRGAEDSYLFSLS